MDSLTNIGIITVKDLHCTAMFNLTRAPWTHLIAYGVSL